MTEHLSDEIVEHYRLHQLDDGARRRADAHLAACDSCVSRIAEAAPNLAFHSLREALLPRAGEEAFHLSDGELERYAFGNTGEADKIICESHVQVCEVCEGKLFRLGMINARPRLWMGLTARGLLIAASIAVIAFLALLLLLARQRARPDETVKSLPPQIPAASPSPALENKESPAEPASQGAIASLKDNGRELFLDADGRLTGAEAFDSETQQMMKRVLSGSSLGKPQVLNELNAGRITLLGDDNAPQGFSLVGPLGQVIETDRPTLKWRSLAGAASYVVSIYDQKFNRVAQSPPLTQTAWAAAAPLPRGNDFFWEVVATKDGKEVTAPVAPAPKAQFKVLAAEHLAALSKLRSQKPESHFALGLAYARFGLITEALGELTALSKDNPNSPELAKLIIQLRRWQR
jgi:hypothetical protein